MSKYGNKQAIQLAVGIIILFKKMCLLTRVCEVYGQILGKYCFRNQNLSEISYTAAKQIDPKLVTDNQLIAQFLVANITQNNKMHSNLQSKTSFSRLKANSKENFRKKQSLKKKVLRL